MTALYNYTFTLTRVLDDVVLSNTNNEVTFEAIQPLLSRWRIYDNQGARGSIPKLLAGSAT